MPCVAGLLVVGVRALRGVASDTDVSPAPPMPVAQKGTDPRLWALERILSSHLESREPNRLLADELRRMADRRLVLRHGIRVAAGPERAAELLGQDTVALLSADPPRRLSLAEVDEVVRRIEQL